MYFKGDNVNFSKLKCLSLTSGATSAVLLEHPNQEKGAAHQYVTFYSRKALQSHFLQNYYAKREYHKTAQKGPQKALNFWQLSYQCFYCVCSRVCPLPVRVKPHNSSALVMRHSNNVLGCLSPDCYHCHAN